MSLRVWLPLDGDLHNQGISDAIATNNGATVDNNGKIGKCYSFNGNNYYIALTGQKLFDCFKGGTTAFSICMWVYHADTRRAILFGDYGLSNSIGFNIELNTGHGLRFYWNGSPDYSPGLNVGLNTWSHIALTYDGTSLKSYLNGNLVATRDGTLATRSKTAGEFRLGRDSRTTNTALNGKLNDIRVYGDHYLSAAEVKEIAQGLVLHYPLNRQNLKPIGTNLVTGITKGGQTSLLTDERVGVVTSGTNGDTYFTINLSETITSGTTYYFSCDVSGVSEGQYWGFPLGAQSNTSMPSKFYNGHNEYIFTANDINWGTNRLFLDDNYRNDYAHPASFYNFVLIKNPTFIATDGSGFGHNGISNAPITTSEDTSRYEEASYFGAYNTPVLTVDNFSSIAPALTSCTITWWGKYDTSKTLLLTGQSTNHYIGASNNNNYYHGNAGSPVMYKDGVSGTYECAADGWHFFALTGVNISTWTTLKINGYGSRWPLNGYISDFRIYCTPLLDTDIKQLYNSSMRVDNLGGIHTFEYNENGSNQLTKTGILYDNIVEPYLTLPDGSNWKLLLYHYVDGGNNLFTSSNATYCNDFGLYSRLRDIDNYTYNGKYEFYVEQDDKQFRWTQTSKPTAASIAGLTTVSGYTNPVNGLAKASQSNTYIGYGSWWGACGCWTKYSTGGKTGIPAFGSHDANGICTTYLALYARIEKPNASIANLSAEATEFIEM